MRLQSETEKARKYIAEFRRLSSKPFLAVKEQQKYHRLRRRLGGSAW